MAQKPLVVHRHSLRSGPAVPNRQRFCRGRVTNLPLLEQSKSSGYCQSRLHGQLAGPSLAPIQLFCFWYSCSNLRLGLPLPLSSTIPEPIRNVLLHLARLFSPQASVPQLCSKCQSLRFLDSELHSCGLIAVEALKIAAHISIFAVDLCRRFPFYFFSRFCPLDSSALVSTGGIYSNYAYNGIMS